MNYMMFGEREYVYAFVRDISERERNLAALSESETEIPVNLRIHRHCHGHN